MPFLTILKYLKLQPVEPSDDGSVSPLDEYQQDEIIDLSADIDEATLDQEWDSVIRDMKKDSDSTDVSQ